MSHQQGSVLSTVELQKNLRPFIKKVRNFEKLQTELGQNRSNKVLSVMNYSSPSSFETDKLKISNVIRECATDKQLLVKALALVSHVIIKTVVILGSRLCEKRRNSLLINLMIRHTDSLRLEFANFDAIFYALIFEYCPVIGNPANKEAYLMCNGNKETEDSMEEDLSMNDHSKDPQNIALTNVDYQYTLIHFFFKSVTNCDSPARLFSLADMWTWMATAMHSDNFCRNVMPLCCFLEALGSDMALHYNIQYSKVLQLIRKLSTNREVQECCSRFYVTRLGTLANQQLVSCFET